MKTSARSWAAGWGGAGAAEAASTGTGQLGRAGGLHTCQPTTSCACCGRLMALRTEAASCRSSSGTAKGIPRTMASRGSSSARYVGAHRKQIHIETIA